MRKGWLRFIRIFIFIVVSIPVGWIAVDFFVQFDSELRTQAKFYIEKGKELRSFRNHSGAAEQFRSAIVLQQKLVDRNPDSNIRLDDLASSHHLLGSMLKAKRDYVGAAEQFRITITLQRKILDRDFNFNRGYGHLHYVLNESYDDLGDVLIKQKDYDGAIKQYELAAEVWEDREEYYYVTSRLENIIELLQILVDDDPDNKKWLESLAFFHLRIGKVLEKRGDDHTIATEATERYTRATEQYEIAIKLLQKLIDDTPNNKNLLVELADTHIDLGGVLFDLGNFYGQSEQYKIATLLWQKLVDSNPDNTEWLDALAASHHKLGMALHWDGNSMEAFEQLRIAISIWQKLVDVGADNNDELAHTHYWLGYVLEFQKDYIDAVKQYKIAIALWEDFIDSDSNNEFKLDNLAESYGGLGGILAKQEDYAGAMKQYNAAYALWQKLLDRDPHNRKLRDIHIKTDLKISELESKL